MHFQNSRLDRIGAALTTNPLVLSTILYYAGALLLGYVTALVPWLHGERREFVVYLSAAFLLPIVLWFKKSFKKLGPFTVVFLLAHILVCSVVSMVYLMEAGLGTSLWVLGLDIVLCFAVYKFNHWLAPRAITGNSEPAFSSWALLAATTIAGNGFWLGFKRIGVYLILPIAAFLTRKAWSVSPLNASVGGRWNRRDVAWLACFLACLLVPLYPWKISCLHHHSFFIGPIHWAKSGHAVFFDIPSQYGFLSIVLPALLPVNSPWVSFQLVHSLLLFAQATLIYSILRKLPTHTGYRLTAGLATILFVFLFPGERGSFLGPWFGPSTSAYRFFWVIALTVLLYPSEEGGKWWKKIPLVSVVVALGTLWSLESAAYVIGTLGIVALADLFFLTTQRQGSWLRWLTFYFSPLAITASTLLLVWFAYRHHYGVSPDLYAIVEYPLAYMGGFGAMPIHPWSSVNFLLLVAGLTAVTAIYHVRCNPMQKTPGRYFVVYAAMITTFSYYCSRSHDSNACNLLAFWLPLMLLNYSTGSAPEATSAIRMIFIPALLVIVTLCLGPNWEGVMRIQALTSLPKTTMDEALVLPPEHEALYSTVRNRIADAPLMVFNQNGRVQFPDVSTKAFPYTPWLPGYPAELLAVLPKERQRIYLDRFFARGGAARTGYVLRRTDIPFEGTALEEFLNQNYRLVHTENIDDKNLLQKFVLK